jgi:hypothetical protein
VEVQHHPLQPIQMRRRAYEALIREVSSVERVTPLMKAKINAAISGSWREAISVDFSDVVDFSISAEAILIMVMIIGILLWKSPAQVSDFDEKTIGCCCSISLPSAAASAASPFAGQRQE